MMCTKIDDFLNKERYALYEKIVPIGAIASYFWSMELQMKTAR